MIVRPIDTNHPMARKIPMVPHFFDQNQYGLSRVAAYLCAGEADFSSGTGGSCHVG